MYLYLKSDFYSLYLCTEFWVGLYIVKFLFKIQMDIMFNETIYFKMLYYVSLEMYTNNLLHNYIPPTFSTDDKLALIKFKFFFF